MQEAKKSPGWVPCTRSPVSPPCPSLSCSSADTQGHNDLPEGTVCIPLGRSPPTPLYRVALSQRSAKPSPLDVQYSVQKYFFHLGNISDSLGGVTVIQNTSFQKPRAVSPNSSLELKHYAPLRAVGATIVDYHNVTFNCADMLRPLHNLFVPASTRGIIFLLLM